MPEGRAAGSQGQVVGKQIWTEGGGRSRVGGTCNTRGHRAAPRAAQPQRPAPRGAARHGAQEPAFLVLGQAQGLLQAVRRAPLSRSPAPQSALYQAPGDPAQLPKPRRALDSLPTTEPGPRPSRGCPGLPPHGRWTLAHEGSLFPLLMACRRQGQAWTSACLTPPATALQSLGRVRDPGCPSRGAGGHPGQAHRGQLPGLGQGIGRLVSGQASWSGGGLEEGGQEGLPLLRSPGGAGRLVVGEGQWVGGRQRGFLKSLGPGGRRGGQPREHSLGGRGWGSWPCRRPHRPHL